MRWSRERNFLVMCGGKVTKEVTVKVTSTLLSFVTSYFFRYILPISNVLLVTLLKFVTVTRNALLLTRYLTSLLQSNCL